MAKQVVTGVNIYSIIGLLLAGAIFFHFTSKEETMTGMIAAVVIVYIVMG